MAARADGAGRVAAGGGRGRAKTPLGRRILRGLVVAIVAALALVATLVFVALTAVDTPWARRFAARELDAELAPMFKGRIVVDAVGHLGLTGASGVDAHVTAPDGAPVLVARGASARINPVALVASLLARRGNLTIDVLDVDVKSLEVSLDTDPAGVLKVQSAFDPALPPPPNPPPPGRPLDLEFPRMNLAHAWVHGQPKGAPPVDADLDGMQAALRVPPGGLALDVHRLHLRTRGLPRGADVVGNVEAHLAMPSKAGADLGVDGAFDGQIGGVPATARGAMDGDRIDAVLDVPEVTVERLRALAPEVPLQRATTAHAEAHGPLGALAVTAHLAAGGSRVDLDGDVSVTGNLAGDVRVDAKDIDLRAVSPTGPASDLSASLVVRARSSAEGLFGGEYVFSMAPGVVAHQALPAASLHGRFQQGKDEVYVDTASSILAFPRSLGAAGHAVLEASATLAFAGPTSLEAHARLALEGLDGAGVKVGAAKLDASVSGPLADPRVKATLEATGLRAAGYAYTQATAAVDGTLARATVAAELAGDGNSSARVRTTVAASGPLRMTDTDVELWRGPRALHAHVDRVAAAGGALDVEGALVTGVGAPTRATVHVRPGSLVVKSDSNGIDLGSLGYLLGAEAALRRGRVSYVVDVTAHPTGLSGTAVVDLNDACFWEVDGLTGHVDTRMTGRTVRGAVDLRAAGIGDVRMDPVLLELAGEEPLAQSSWRRASGDVQLSGDVDLAKLVSLLPPNDVPVAGVSGQLRVAGHVVRSAASDALPDVTLSLKTAGLRFETRSAPDVPKGKTTVVAPPAASESGIDVTVDLEAKGAAGTGEVTASLLDAGGTVLSISVTGRDVPYGELASAGPALTDRLLRLPFSARLAMPARSLDRLPDAVRIDGATGTADLAMSVEGTALAPRVEIRGGLHSVRLLDARGEPPLEAELTGSYDGAAANVALHVREAGAKDPHDELLAAAARANAKIADVIERGVPAWDASASATLSRFPLGAVPALSDRRVHGTVDGKLELTGLHRDARAKLDVDVGDLRVGKVPYGAVRLRSAFDGREVDADLHVDQGADPGAKRAIMRPITSAANPEGGSADAKARLALRWGAAIAPSPDPSGSAHASLTAKKLRIGFIAPFIQSAADALDGVLNADAHVNLNPHQKPEMSGTIAIGDGVLGLATLGQELHAVSAHVVFTPDGVVRLQDASASATAGKITAVGVARLDGTALVGAEIDAQILKGDAMPLDVEGSDLGSVYGKFVVKMATSADRASTTLAVDVPSLHVRLPDASTHSVQDLGDSPPNDYIGTFSSPGRFVALSMDGHQAAQAAGNEAATSTLLVNVHLGDAQIARGTDVRVDLGGSVAMKVEKKTTMTGQIAIKNGKLDVQGKSFEIESGTVTFTGDPANPDIKVTAGWTAEDGTRVLADYLGPLKTGKVTLRSEPARPQNEIVALIAFGTADGSESTPYQTPTTTDTGTQAGTTVGGFATSGLSKGLDKLTGLDITAKIDTSQANPRPEVEVQIARDISLELSVVLGTPPPGTNQDTTYATVDWRFHRNWSLETTFGNQGSSIADVLWRRRY